MRKQDKFIFAIATFLTLATAFEVANSFNINTNEVTALGTYRTDRPSTINPNDATDTQIRSYYSSLNGLAVNERKGNNLLKNLKPILANNSYYYSYTNTWDVFMITDRDWIQSPLASYSGYSYSDNPYVHLLYRNDNGTSTAAHFNDTHGTYIDREHVWPQSRGFGASTATGPAGTDVHHLILGDSVNNRQGHNNYAWGDEDHGIISTPIGTVERHNNTGIRWTAIDENSGSDNIYEPQDIDKGDIARAVFYMAARYNNWAGITGAISNYEPFLQVTDNIYDSGLGTIYSTNTTPVSMGILSTLLKWHEQDPVDNYEIHRNNLIYFNYQNNRNPFIDFPEWVEAVYGTEGKVATPSTDVINGYNTSDILVTSIVLNHDSLTLTSGGASTTLIASISPIDATNKNLNWTSTNNSVATVSDGVVTPIGVGNASITATALDGSEVHDSCPVNVVAEHEKVLEYIEVTGNSGGAAFGSTFDTSNIVVTAYYDDYSQATVTNDAIINSPDTQVLGEQTISVIYGGKTTYYFIDVTNEGAVFSPGEASDLIISEYIEGSSNNKAIEIYNGTGITKNLTNYRLFQYNAGGTSKTYILSLSGSINSGSTFVVANSSANSNILSKADMSTNSSLMGFNGNDTVALQYNNVDIDVVGVLGSSNDFAKDVTLVRKTNVSGPNVEYNTDEWVSYPTDTTTFLGSHTMSLPSPITDLNQAEAWAEYFLAETSAQCQLLEPQDSDVWLRLENEYDFMTTVAQDYYSGGEATSIIIQAINRYNSIITAHPENAPFISNVSTANDINIIRTDNSLIIVFILVSISFLSVASFLIIKKRKMTD